MSRRAMWTFGDDGLSIAVAAHEAQPTADSGGAFYNPMEGSPKASVELRVEE